MALVLELAESRSAQDAKVIRILNLFSRQDDELGGVVCMYSYGAPPRQGSAP